MKTYQVRFIAITPLGTFNSALEIGRTSEQVDALNGLLQSELSYLTFRDDNNNVVILKKELLENSAFKVWSKEETS